MGNIPAVFLFEWKRSMTMARMAWWLVLAGFPIFIVGLVRYSAYTLPSREVWALTLFALGPLLIVMMGTLLWMTPAVSVELERRSWVYLAVRPHGTTAVLLGKYLAAVSWVLPPAIIGMTAAVLLTNPTWSDLVHNETDWVRLWWAILRLILLACPAYAAIYLLIGCILPRRAMVLAVVYSLLFEVVVSLIPAMINNLTIHFRLRALLVHWLDLIPSTEKEKGIAAFLGNAPAWEHIAILLATVPVLLGLSILVIRVSEFSSAAESDV